MDYYVEPSSIKMINEEKFFHLVPLIIQIYTDVFIVIII